MLLTEIHFLVVDVQFYEQEKLGDDPIQPEEPVPCRFSSTNDKQVKKLTKIIPNGRNGDNNVFMFFIFRPLVAPVIIRLELYLHGSLLFPDYTHQPRGIWLIEFPVIKSRIAGQWPRCFWTSSPLSRHVIAFYGKHQLNWFLCPEIHWLHWLSDVLSGRVLINKLWLH